MFPRTFTASIAFRVVCSGPGAAFPVLPIPTTSRRRGLEILRRLGPAPGRGCQKLGMHGSTPGRLDGRTGAQFGLTWAECGKLSAISKISERMEETAELLERSIGVVFFAGVLVVTVCVVVLVGAGTFAVLHPGNDFGDVGSGGGRGGDIIFLPAQPF